MAAAVVTTTATTADTDKLVAEWAAAVHSAADKGRTLQISGGNSKAFYGGAVAADAVLNTADYKGVVSYEPSELVVTVRAGTPLRELVAVLAENNQELAFEPPQFANTDTVGGMVACGLSGPARPYKGSVREAVLGVKMINGQGQVLRFGGEVIKNVAGYDVSRLLVGSLGILGVILEVSLRVAPQPPATATFVCASDKESAMAFFRQLARQYSPVSATAWWQGQRFIRLSGSEQWIESQQKKWQSAGQDMARLDEQVAAGFWHQLRDHRHAFFTQATQPLWRVSAPPFSSLPMVTAEQSLIEWGGALHWYSGQAGDEWQAAITAAGAHATCFSGRGNTSTTDTATFPPFPPLSKTVWQLHQALKKSFDPHEVFNPNKMYAGL